MSHFNIIARQRECLNQLWAAEAARLETESQSPVHREARAQASQTAVVAAQRAQELLGGVRPMKGEAQRLTLLPTSRFTPKQSTGDPLEHLRHASRLASQELWGIREAVPRLNECRAAQERAKGRVKSIVAITIIVIVLALVAYVATHAERQSRVQVPAQAQTVARATERIQNSVAHRSQGA